MARQTRRWHQGLGARPAPLDGKHDKARHAHQAHAHAHAHSRTPTRTPTHPHPARHTLMKVWKRPVPQPTSATRSMAGSSPRPRMCSASGSSVVRCIASWRPKKSVSVLNSYTSALLCRAWRMRASMRACRTGRETAAGAGPVTTEGTKGVSARRAQEQGREASASHRRAPTSCSASRQTGSGRC
jgi:hypothetical protein